MTNLPPGPFHLLIAAPGAPPGSGPSPAYRAPLPLPFPGPCPGAYAQHPTPMLPAMDRCRRSPAPCPAPMRPPLPGPRGKPGDGTPTPPSQYDWYGDFLIFQSGRVMWRVPNQGQSQRCYGRLAAQETDYPLLIPSPIIKQAFWRGNSQLKLGVLNDYDGGRGPGQGSF